ncbi:MAG: Ribonuclease [archaeon GW2011_AR20]|nr:MAG: Ribonuclease [archaeon GW2011_AR20]MBS3160882.1 ribonuclease HII [Candidatus Woesearchaeota archaeon]
MVNVLGIDEAGKGPVLGSLFICGVLIEEKDTSKLKKIGVKDSKLLTHKKRIELAKEIKKIAKKYKIVQIKPEEIDKAVSHDHGMNLNWLEAHKTALIINELNPDKAIIDCPSPNTRKYQEYLLNLLNNKNVELVVEHKAEKYYPVGAASILAKCAREEEMDDIKKKYGNTGPGYSSNAITQKFVKENFDRHPEIFRKSWSTWKNHAQAKNQKKLDEF